MEEKAAEIIGELERGYKKMTRQSILEMFPTAIKDMEAITDLGGRVYGYGSWKEPDNSSLQHKNNVGSMFRHLSEFYMNKQRDSESGENPLLHLIWRAMAAYERSQMDIDIYPIPEYRGQYSITVNGTVWSHKTNKFMKSYDCGNYKAIKLRTDNGAYQHHYIHRLVASTFLGSSELDVNHRDGDPHNNNIENLEYCTRSENLQHALELNLIPHGEDVESSKLSNQDVLDIRREYEEGNTTHQKLADKYGVGRRYITDIINYVARKRD